jgi:hypothetical protein
MFNFIMNSGLIDLWIPKIIKHFVLFIDHLRYTEGGGSGNPPCPE